LFLWKRKTGGAKAESATVGLAIIDGEVTAVVCDGESEGHPHVVAWATLPNGSPDEFQAALRKFVEMNDLQGWPCRCSLSPESYSLRLVDRPTNIPDEELVDATRWLVRDLIEFDVEQAGLTILTIPEDNSRARTPRMFVVAAKHEIIQELSIAIEGAGLQLAGFEIVESAMLALESRMSEVVAGSAALRIDDKASVLTLSYAKHLYLARNLHVDADSIETAAQHALNDPSPSNPEVVELLDALLLDIQRSLDYYESEYGQAGASRLSLLPSHADLTPLLPALSEALRPIKVETYDLPHYFDFDDLPPTNTHPAMALAAGAAISDPDLIGDALLPSNAGGSTGGLGLGSVVGIAAAIAAILGIYSGVSWRSLGQERVALSTIESGVAGLSAEVETLRAAAAVRATQANPRKQIETLRATRDARLALLRDLGQHRSNTGATFSSLLTGLARQDIDGVWLERIVFTEGGDSIAIEGRTLEAEDVPTFLRRLGREQSFEGRNFRTFEMTRQASSSDALVFRVATRGRNTSGDGGEP